MRPRLSEHGDKTQHNGERGLLIHPIRIIRVVEAQDFVRSLTLADLRRRGLEIDPKTARFRVFRLRSGLFKVAKELREFSDDSRIVNWLPYHSPPDIIPFRIAFLEFIPYHRS
jgi:hypothetical protein